MQDYHQAPIPERTRAALAFLEKLTLHPEEVEVADAQALLAAGVDEQAAEQVVMVCFLFSVMDRLADAFEYGIPPESMGRSAARLLDKTGYGIMG